MHVLGMDALLVSTLTVALAEIGDKTQLLALLLAARYRKPLPVIAGIVVATLVNHAASAWVGAWLATVLSPVVLRWAVVVSFLAVAAWALVPDKLDDAKAPEKSGLAGIFFATVVAFFLVEIGDKTQVATIVLAARYHPLWQVVSGTTLGMLIANVPVVLLGARFAHRLPLRAARWTAAAVFVALGLWVALFGL
jgi:putative Ca2+/H+ antiporter (TMEM165/GDT1 family)